MDGAPSTPPPPHRPPSVPDSPPSFSSSFSSSSPFDIPPLLPPAESPVPTSTPSPHSSPATSTVSLASRSSQPSQVEALSGDAARAIRAALWAYLRTVDVNAVNMLTVFAHLRGLALVPENLPRSMKLQIREWSREALVRAAQESDAAPLAQFVGAQRPSASSTAETMPALELASPTLSHSRSALVARSASDVGSASSAAVVAVRAAVEAAAIVLARSRAPVPAVVPARGAALSQAALPNGVHALHRSARDGASQSAVTGVESAVASLKNPLMPHASELTGSNSARRKHAAAQSGKAKRKRTRKLSRTRKSRGKENLHRAAGAHDAPIVLDDDSMADDSDSSAPAKRVVRSSSSSSSPSSSSSSSSASSSSPSSSSSSEDDSSSSPTSDGEEDARKASHARSNKKKRRKKSVHRKRRKPRANEPVGVDDSGKDVWEVKELLRSDVDSEGRRVYKVSWYNWTGWPQFTWIARDEWLGSDSELDRIEARERTSNGKRRLSMKSKSSKGNITATSSWAHDQKREREWELTCERKAERDRLAKEKKQQQQHNLHKQHDKAALHRKSHHRKDVQREHRDDSSSDEAADDASPLQVASPPTETAEEHAERLRKKREESKRRREEENARQVPFVRASSEVLVPWSSDDDLAEEDAAPPVAPLNEEQDKARFLRLERHQRRQQLRMRQLTEFQLGKSRPRSMTLEWENDDGGVHSPSQAAEAAGVHVHPSELTGSDSEREMDKWRQERRYRVDRILDHRAGDGEGHHEREERLRLQQKKRKKADQHAPRQNVFDRVQRAHEADAGLDDSVDRGDADADAAWPDGGQRNTDAEDDADMEDPEDAAVEADGAPVKRCFKVKWTAQGERAATWEHEPQLHGCEMLLRAYKEQEGLVKPRSKSKRKKSRR